MAITVVSWMLQIEYTGMYCTENIIDGVGYDLLGCKSYCQANNASKLTYYPYTYTTSIVSCVCCTSSSRFSRSNAGTEVYTLEGN